MKKSIAACLVVFCALSLFSGYPQKRVFFTQDRSPNSGEWRKVQFGLGVGLNFSSLNADWDSLVVVGHSGLNVDFILKYRPTKTIGLQSGIQFSTQGVSFEDDDGIKMSYFQIPLVLKVYAWKGLNFEIGPQLGARANVTLLGFLDQGSENDNESFAFLDFSARLGVNYEFWFGLFISGHYNLGLSNVSDTETGSVIPVSVSNRVIQVGIGYYF